MSKKIKKLIITTEKGGFRCVQPNEIERQSITIKNNGQVWWNITRTLTLDEMANGFPNNGVRITEYKNIGRENAEKILILSEQVFKNKIDTKFNTLIDDACADEIYIFYDNNEFICGELDYSADALNEIDFFYDYLSKELLIEKLFHFDN